MGKFKFLKKSQSGFSMIELLVGSGLAAAVAVGGGYVVYKSHQLNYTASWQTELNREHLLSLQRAKNTDRIAQLLNLKTAQAQACFAKKSANNDCAGLNVPDFRTLNDPDNNCGTDCAYDKRIQYKINCTGNQCDGVYLQVSTALTQSFAASRNVTAMPREATIHIPGNMFASRKQLDFRCTSGNKYVSLVSFDNLSADCQAFEGATSCSSSDPLQNFGGGGSNANCQQMVSSNNCQQFGYSQLGVFNGQAGCNSGGSGIINVGGGAGGGGSCAYSLSPCDCTTRNKIATITIAGASCPYTNGQSIACSSAELSGRCPAGGTCTPNYLNENPGNGVAVPLTSGLVCYCPANSTATTTGNGETVPTAPGCKCNDGYVVSANGLCEPCPGGTTRSGRGAPHPGATYGEKCRCAGENDFWADNRCQTCIGGSTRGSQSGEIVPGTGNACRCPNDQKWVASENKCKPAACFSSTITSLGSSGETCTRPLYFPVSQTECVGARCLAKHPMDATWGDGSGMLALLCKRKGFVPQSQFSYSHSWEANRNQPLGMLSNPNSPDQTEANLRYVPDNSCHHCRWMTSITCKQELPCADCRPIYKTQNCPFFEMPDLSGGGGSGERIYTDGNDGESCDPASYSGGCTCTDVSGCSRTSTSTAAAPPQTITKPTRAECETAAAAAIAGGSKLKSDCAPKYTDSECGIAPVTPVVTAGNTCSCNVTTSSGGTCPGSYNGGQLSSNSSGSPDAGITRCSYNNCTSELNNSMCTGVARTEWMCGGDAGFLSGPCTPGDISTSSGIRCECVEAPDIR